MEEFGPPKAIGTRGARRSPSIAGATVATGAPRSPGGHGIYGSLAQPPEPTLLSHSRFRPLGRPRPQAPIAAGGRMSRRERRAELPQVIIQSGWDGAVRRSSSGSPSPLRSPAACLLRAYASAHPDSRHSTGTGALAYQTWELLSSDRALTPLRQSFPFPRPILGWQDQLPHPASIFAVASPNELFSEFATCNWFMK